MRATKEAQLNFALLQYIALCVDEGDFAALRRLGLNRADAEAARALTFADFEHLLSSRFIFLHMNAIDRGIFRRLLDHIAELKEQQTLRDALLQADAPLALMHCYFGMDSNEYAERGRALGLLRCAGRPRVTNDDDEQIAWHDYENLRGANDDLTAQDWLMLSQNTGIPLRRLWLLVATWKRIGEPVTPAKAVVFRRRAG